MNIEVIKHNNNTLGLIIPADYQPSSTEFITPDGYLQQIGFILYPSEGSITPHIHNQVERNIQGTSETLLIRNGHCYIDFYLEDKSLFCTRELKTGDIVALVGGGHGFRMVEDTVFMEVKQGPYVGLQDKTRFDPKQSV